MRTIRIILITLASALICQVAAQTPSLVGVRICIDPGHGGRDANDRETDLGIDTLYYESDANWDAALHMDTLLRSLGAEVKLTRTTNDPDAPDRDPSLADRVQVGNAFGADYFHSFHTNAFSDPTINYTLVLYPGPEDGIADFPESVEMAEIMAEELFKVMRTTSTRANADIPFTGFMNGLGVLNNLTMPGTLSEASFHSNLDEGRRLMSADYRRAASWSLIKSFLRYFEQPIVSTGQVGGIVTDRAGNALNEIEVRLTDNAGLDTTYHGDLFLNGYYFFDFLLPGQYEVSFYKEGYEEQVKTIGIEKGLYTEVDAVLNLDGGAPTAPILTSILAYGENDGLHVQWEQNPEVSLLGYRLYYATNDELDEWELAVDEGLLTSELTEYVVASSKDFSVAPEDDVYHFKLTAVAESGAESGSGDVYSRSTKALRDQILIVDGFTRRSGSYKEKDHCFAANYLVGIRDSNAAGISTTSNHGLLDSLVLLDSFDMVLWFLGDESTADETLSPTEQEMLASYLQQGGKLLITGAEIGWDLDNRGTMADKAFYRDFLKARYEGDGAIGFTPATGVPSTLFEEVEVSFGVRYEEDFPDEISPLEGAEELLSYLSPGRTAAIGYKGMFLDGSSDGGLVNIGFAVETALQEDITSLIGHSLLYLEIENGNVSTTDEDFADSERWAMKVSPNPVSGHALLSITRMSNLETKGLIRVKVFNNSGELIFSQAMPSNARELELMIPSANWPSGSYVITISDLSVSQSMVLIKAN